MTRFFLKLALFMTVVLTPYMTIQYQRMTELDAFYWKSTHRANSLIVGGSRAAQGISPAVLKEGLSYDGEVLNFAFNGISSPYGAAYYELIQRKIAKGTKDAIFIFSVSPGLVMDYPADGVKREDSFRFYDLWNVNMHPNLEYVFRAPRSQRSLAADMIGFFASKQKRKLKGQTKMVYPDGWVSVNLDAEARQRLKSKDRIPSQLKYDLVYSEERLAYLEQTIAFLHQYGKVVLTRVPVNPVAYQREQEMYPAFDRDMQALTDKYEGLYLDYAKPNGTIYFYNDKNRHHLEGESARKFTQQLAADIKAGFSQ